MEDELFDKIDGALNPLTVGEYENCRFTNCNLSETRLVDLVFVDCEFENCNLSLADLTQTTLRNASFRNCKMLGLHFDRCNEFGLVVAFEKCNLSHASFYGTKLKKTVFKDLTLHDVDFAGCDLTGSVFDNCDLARASFENTGLEKADFRTSFNYSIDPARNRIKKAKFSLSGAPGLLDGYAIEIDLTR